MEFIDKSKKKLIAYCLCLFIAMFSCFSFYMVSEAVQHDCIGDNCTTCAYLDTVAEGLKQLGDGAVVTAEAVFVYFHPQDSVVLGCLTIIVPITLVSTKVRLND